jgi:hypothetical protein
MRFTLLAVAVGFVLAVVLGGRPRSLIGLTLRLWFLLPLGLALHIAATEQPGHVWPLVLTLLGYGSVVVFTVANLSVTGMWMVALGLTLNALVIGLNHGMPVGKRAAATIGHRPAVYAVEHHVERSSEKLAFLGDTIPLQPIGEAVSFGDLILGIGLIDVIVRLLRPAPARRRRDDQSTLEPLPLVGASATTN